mmetsp:Transcript_500/g.557  ORF Transcript_500/g.557 Transcript_500/m.557 type:complete len:252 (-) Transcript_500:278-1033(-)|eukprot:CAMPEP_0197845492 /NCGR_PEP_ID=MMETSP1438-20131217/2412_1 /TAXON_ID=1461541 /ORGANISM="Pterosperma sp., Strain CCMP1384" /LENGTH=251 /DNA_ID=CAMNT_0043456805 /DNA_START=132 /DNA_END=887 /DNA_ORIENTATION=-
MKMDMNWNKVLVALVATCNLASANAFGGLGAFPFLRTGLVTGGDAEALQPIDKMDRIVELESDDCPKVQTQKDFDLDEFISKPWYIQAQAPTTYLPVSENYCVSAHYSKLAKKSFWGYEIQVHNIAQEANGKVHDSGSTLCAAEDTSPDPAKLEVAPCFLPKAVAGPYWVIAYDSTKGYALISGGQPTIKTAHGCKSGSGVNDSGLWIFTTAQERDEAVVQEVKSLAAAQGFDVTILNDVDQTKCKSSLDV